MELSNAGWNWMGHSKYYQCVSTSEMDFKWGGSYSWWGAFSPTTSISILHLKNLLGDIALKSLIAWPKQHWLSLVHYHMICIGWRRSLHVVIQLKHKANYQKGQLSSYYAPNFTKFIPLIGLDLGPRGYAVVKAKR